jgi:hypothetical protein
MGRRSIGDFGRRRVKKIRQHDVALRFMGGFYASSFNRISCGMEADLPFLFIMTIAIKIYRLTIYTI